MRNIILLFFLSVTYGMAAAQSRTDSLYSLLDEAIANSDRYVEKREGYIRHTRGMYANAGMAARYSLALELYKEYSAYMSDSALVWLERAATIARRLGDGAGENRCRVLKAYLCSSTGMYTEEQLEILLEKATQYLKNPPANPFSPEDPHWIQNEIWIRAARCASLDLVIDRLFFVGDPIELWNLIQELALDDSDPIIRMAALKQIESLKRLAYEQNKEKILISPDTVLNEIRTARDEEYPFVRYLAQQVSLSRSYKNWRYLNLENPLEYSLYYYQFPGEQIITPKTHQTYQR